MISLDDLLTAFAQAIYNSHLAMDILKSEFVQQGRFVRAFDSVMDTAFKKLGYVVKKEISSPWIIKWKRENPDKRISLQRADYLLVRKYKPVAIAELESLDRAQLNTFICQYYDWDGGKRDYYWATVDYLANHPEADRPEFFLFFLTLPDFPVSPYQIWDIGWEDYYGVTGADRKKSTGVSFYFMMHVLRRYYMTCFKIPIQKPIKTGIGLLQKNQNILLSYRNYAS